MRNIPVFTEGYPIPLSKKTCARVVTYQQCVDQHFEKTPHLLKRKDFMKNFFERQCELRRCFAHFDSPRRFSLLSAYCESCCLIFGRKADSVGMRIHSMAVARKLSRDTN